MKRWIALLATLTLLTFVFPAAADGTKYSRTMMGLFHTDVTLIGYCESQAEFDHVADQTLARLNEYNKIFDAYNSYPGLNNLWYVNRYAGQGPVEIPDELYDLIVWCQNQWNEGRQETNIALGAVLSIWHDYRTAGMENPAAAQIPDRTDLQNAMAHTNFDDVILNPQTRTVYFADPQLKLDIGAVAKGYAADLLGEYLSTEMPSFLLSLGGNVLAGDAPQDGRRHWGVSVQDPNGIQYYNIATDILDVLYVDGVSVVTSGDYMRYYTVNGQRYHHIIDPDTLMPASHMRAVTVVCPSSTLADFMTTTLFTMPYEEGRALVEEMDGVEALWVLGDHSIKMSSGMAQYARSMGASSTK